MDNQKIDHSQQIQHKSTKYVLAIVMTATCGSILYGLGVTVISPIEKFYFTHVYPKTNKDLLLGIINGFLAFGGMIGSATSSYIINSLGRKKGFFIGNVIAFIGSILCFCTNQYAIFAIGRLVFGYGIGIFSVLVPIYINEISPKSISGMMGALHNLMLTIGMFLNFALGLFMPDFTVALEKLSTLQKNWWRVMLGFPILIILLNTILLLTFFSFDTPTFLVSINKKEEAEAVLEKIYQPNDVSPIFLQIQEKISNSKEIKLSELFSVKYSKSFGDFV